MITNVIMLGNTKAVQIPEEILRQLEVDDQLEISLDEIHQEIVLRPVHNSLRDVTISNDRTLNQERSLVEESSQNGGDYWEE